MKFSERWLREWVNPPVATEALCAQLTMAGLEIDGVEPVAGVFSGVVVGQILSVEPHPAADKLRVCQVDSGAETLQIVCGAANARAGIKVPLATVGAALPGDLKIGKAKLRSVESFGMLCAAQELGLAEKSDGLLELPDDAPVGTDIRQYLQLDDVAIEVDLTPNRADCLSIRGMAREAGVLNKIAVSQLTVKPVIAAIEDRFPVEVLAAAECPRYVGRVIRGVDVSRPTPLWMQQRLQRAGSRSIDVIVDITNYVLLELGQPLHAFDLGSLQGGISVRKAKTGEQIELLDGQTLSLRDDTLVIADQSGPVALAGIMGGKPTAVSAQTRDIFLESAFFAPLHAAGKARSYGLHTDSSHRFERGVDYELQALAAERATQLIVDIAGGSAGPLIDLAQRAELPQRAPIALRAARIQRLLGLDIPPAQVTDMLVRLGMSVQETASGWQVVAPSWRFDINIEADLLEELARVYGYEQLPVAPIRAELGLRPCSEKKIGLVEVRHQLLARGYQEAITYSFVKPALQELLCPGEPVVAVSNPISADLSVMRTSLWTGLVDAAMHNLNRQQNRVRLFETGLRFLPGTGTLPAQEPMLAGLLTGSRHPEGWFAGAESADFFDLKGDVESLLALGGEADSFAFRPVVHPALHPGQSAAIWRGSELVGHLGTLHPRIQQQLDVAQPLYLFELRQQPLLTAKLPIFTELSRFPEVRRDLAILVGRECAVQTVADVIRAAAGEDLRNLRLFDIYEGKGIDPKRKSLAFGLTFRSSSRTLTEDEINSAIRDVVTAVEQQLGATLRT